MKCEFFRSCRLAFSPCPESACAKSSVFDIVLCALFSRLEATSSLNRASTSLGTCGEFSRPHRLWRDSRDPTFILHRVPYSTSSYRRYRTCSPVVAGNVTSGPFNAPSTVKGNLRNTLQQCAARSPLRPVTTSPSVLTKLCLLPQDRLAAILSVLMCYTASIATTCFVCIQ